MEATKKIYTGRCMRNYFIRRCKKYSRWKKNSGIVINRNAEACNENGFPDYNQDGTNGILYRHDLLSSLN